jgi:hypothetical protein
MDILLGIIEIPFAIFAVHLVVLFCYGIYSLAKARFKNGV